MERKLIDRYFDEIINLNPLSIEEEKNLSERILQGDGRAADKLVTANLKFVVAIARQYQGNGVDIEDLISEGNIAMLQAAYKYDASKSQGRFVSFALPFIRKSMEKALSDTQFVFSVDAPLGGRDNVSLLDVIQNTDSPLADSLINDNALSDSMQSGLSLLDERERNVIKYLYGIGCDKHTMAETGVMLGLKRERVRQLRDKALRKMKKNK